MSAPTEIFDGEGMHVLDATIINNQLVLDVETDQTLAGRPTCGVIAVASGRRAHRLLDVPYFGFWTPSPVSPSR